MMASPSRYLTPAVPVVHSVVSFARVSTELVWEVYSPEILDVFPTFEPYPDTSLYVPTTSPDTPALSEGPVQLLGTKSLSPWGPVSMDIPLACDIITQIRTSAAHTMHSNLCAYYCDCCMQVLIKSLCL